MAQGFKFRLQKVLEMREQREKLLHKRFMELLAAAEYEKQILQDLYQRQHTYREELSARQQGNIEVGEVMQYFKYLEALAERIDEQILRVQEAEERAEEARRDLMKAQQEKKAVEKLKEKQLEDFIKEEQRKEVIFLDEVSSSRFNRQQADAARRAAPGRS